MANPVQQSFQLFEFNDTTTRTNFINIVERLRDVRVREYHRIVIVCDETNNTPDVVDAISLS